MDSYSSLAITRSIQVLPSGIKAGGISNENVELLSSAMKGLPTLRPLTKMLTSLGERSDCMVMEMVACDVEGIFNSMHELGPTPRPQLSVL